MSWELSCALHVMVWESKRQENTLSGEKKHVNSGEFPKVIQDEKSDLLEVK